MSFHRSDAEAFLSSPLARFKPWEVDGRSPQRDFMRAAATHRTRIIRAGNQAQPVDEPVLTPDGWRPIGDLCTGDEVIGGDGAPARVLVVYPQGRRPVFRVTFDDGASTRCCDAHLWKVLDREARFRRASPNASRPRSRKDSARLGAWRVLPLSEIRAKWGDAPVPLQRVAIPVACAALPARDLPIDPYVLGVLLGDGSLGLSGISLSCWDEEIVARVAVRLPAGDRFRKPAEHGYQLATPNATRGILDRLGLVGKDCFGKFVPAEYLRASIEQRTELLRGLMDTDGTVGKTGHVTFTSTSRRLAEDVQALARSLGGKATLRERARPTYTYLGEKKKGAPAYVVALRTPGVVPFALARKAARCFRPTSRADHRVLRRIEPAGEAECVCIAVSSPDRTYVTRDYVVTHNCGKTTMLCYDTLLACLGLHPFCRFRPPIRCWLSALDWEFGVGQILWPTMRAMLPRDRVRSILWYRKQKDVELPATIVFDTGSRIEFKSAEAGRTKYQGAPLHRVGLDEEHPSDIGEECKPRLLKYGGELIMSLTPVRRERWILETEKEPGTHVTRMSTLDAARAGILDEKAVRAFGDSLPDRQRAVRLEGDFAALAGLVYPSFHRTSHLLVPRDGTLFRASGEYTGTPWPLPASWPRFAAMDFGYSNAACVIVAALDPGRWALIIERVFYCSGIRASRWATILAGVQETPGVPARPGAMPPLAAPIICDHDAGERAELEYQGLPTIMAQKDIAPGLEVVERWLEPRRDQDGRPRVELVVDEMNPPRHPDVGRIDARALQDELEAYRYPEARNSGRVVAPSDPKDLPMKKDDHACDALRYLLMFIENHWRPEGPTPLRLGEPEDLLDGRLLRASAPGFGDSTAFRTFD